MVQLLCQDAELYPRFRERIVCLEERGGRLGWGYGDLLCQEVNFLEAELIGG
jgi:hypothetical protein